LTLSQRESKEAVKVVNDNSTAGKLIEDDRNFNIKTQVPLFLDLEQLLYNCFCCQVMCCTKGSKSFRKYQ